MKLHPAPVEKPDKAYVGNGKCRRCGYCCYDFWCALGDKLHGGGWGPCPELFVDDEGRYCCRQLLTLTGPRLERLKEALGVGMGCGRIPLAAIRACLEGLRL